MAGIGEAFLKVQIIADSKKAISEIDKTGGKFGSLGKVAKIGGAAVAAGVAVASVAAVKFGKAAIKAAGDQDDAFDHMGVTFGKSATDMEQWAKDAAKNYGLTSVEAADMAAKIGNKLRGIGVPMDKAASQTKELAAKAVDMASAYGGTAADAVGALTKAMSGQTKGLKAYGVSITKGDIAAQRLADHTSKLTGEAGKQAEAQAILTLTYKKTSDAQGAYKDNAGDLASQQERLSAQMTNLKATVGTALLPIFQKLAQFALDKLMPALQGLWDLIGPTLIKAVLDLSSMFTRTLVPALAVAWSWLATYLTPIFKTIAGFITGTLVPAWGTLTGLLTGAFPGAIAKSTSAISPLLSALKGFWSMVTGTLIPAVMSIWDVIATKTAPAFAAYAKIVQTQVMPAVAALAAFFVSTVIPTWLKIETVIAKFVIPVMAALARIVFGTLIPFLLKLAGIITSSIVPILRGILVPVFAAVNSVVAKVSVAINNNRDKFAKLAPIVNATVAVVRALWSVFQTLLVPILKVVMAVLIELAKIVGKVLGAAFSALGSAISIGINILGNLASAIGSVINAVKSLVDWIKKIKFPSIPGALKKLNPFMVPPSGGGGAPVPMGASVAPRALLGGSGGHAATAGSGGVTINVSGALDPVAVARQIQSVLSRQGLRYGTIPGLSPGWAQVGWSP